MQKENIEAVLKEYDCPYMGTDLVSGGTVKDIQVDGNNVTIKIVLGWPAEGIMQAFHENLTKKMLDAYPDAKLTLDLSYEIIPHTVQQSLERVKGIKNIKKGRILRKTSDIFDLIVRDLNNNDYLMIIGSNSTGLNNFVKILKGNI